MLLIYDTTIVAVVVVDGACCSKSF